MPFAHECIDCGSEFDVPEELAGKQATCAACGALMDLPAAAAEVQFPAPDAPAFPAFPRQTAPPPPLVPERPRTPEPFRQPRAASFASSGPDQAKLFKVGLVFAALLMALGAGLMMFLSVSPKPAVSPRARSSRVKKRHSRHRRPAYLYVDNNSSAPLITQLDGGTRRTIVPWDIMRLTIKPGRHTLTVTGQGQAAWKQRINVKAGRTYIADPSRIGRYVTWAERYSRRGTQVGSRRYREHGGRRWIALRSSIQVHLREKIASGGRKRRSMTQTVLRKRPPRMFPAALIELLLDPKQAKRFDEVYLASTLSAAIEQGAKQGLPQVPAYLMHRLRRVGRLSSFELKIMERYASVLWLPALTAFMVQPASAPIDRRILRKFVALAGATELKAVFGSLMPTNRTALLGQLSGKPFAIVVEVALLGMKQTRTRTQALNLLLKPGLAKHPEALKAVLKAIESGGTRISWRDRAQLLGVLLSSGDATEALRKLLRSTLVSCPRQHVNHAGTLVDHLRGRQVSAMLAEVLPKLGERLRRQLFYNYHRAQLRGGTDLSSEPFLLAGVKDPSNSVRSYVLQVLVLPKWQALPACRKALLEAASAGRLARDSQMVQLLVQAALQAPPANRASELVGIVPQAGKHVDLVMRAITGLPDAEREDANKRLWALFAQLPDATRNNIVNSLTGTRRIHSRSWQRFARLLKHTVPAVRLHVFSMLLRYIRYYKELENQLIEAARRETDPPTSAAMKKLIAPTISRRARARGAARDRGADEKIRDELQMLGVRLANKEPKGRLRVYKLTADKRLEVASAAIDLLRRYPVSRDLRILRQALSHPHRDVRSAAIRAAARHGEHADALRIYQQAARDKQLWVRKRTYDTLLWLSRQYPRVKKLFVAVLKREPDQFTRKRYQRYIK